MKQPYTRSSGLAQSQFLSGGGMMGTLIRSYDWRLSSLGSIDSWPQSLRSALSICLNSNFPIAIYWGKDLTLIYNDAWSPIPGNKNPWALGKPAKEVWPDIWDEIEPQFQKTFTGEPGGSKDALLPMQRHGYTEECYFDFTFTPVYGEAGKVEGVFNAVIETTYRVTRERRSAFLKNFALKLAESKRNSDLFSQAISLLNGASPDISFATIYRVSDNTPKLVASTLSHEEHSKQKKAWPFETVLSSGKSLFIQDISDFFDHPPKNLWPEAIKEVCIQPLIDGSGNCISILVCGLNARRRFDDEYSVFIDTIAGTLATAYNVIAALEEERKKATALAEIDKAKTLFFSNISHEFRTPLTLMLGSLEELLKKPVSEVGNGTLTSIKTTHRNAIRLLRLVNNLLDFSRLEAGKVKAKYQLTDVAALTEEIAGSFRSIIENAGLKFTVDCKPVTPAVYLDRTMWEKIVLNLLSNAFKYTLAGEISVHLISDGRRIVLKVKDTGVGIPEKELPKMFERFHRIENSTGRTYEGTGIGLSLVYELVKLHKGIIDVTSHLGKGSEFIVTLPMGKQHLSKSRIIDKDIDDDIPLSDMFVLEAATLTENDITETSNNLNTAKENRPAVLVVDDNADMRRYFSTLLQDDYFVITAANGKEALQRLKEDVPALIVSDVMMPVMDGIELLKVVKENVATSSIPVILVSARAGENEKIEGIDLGADDYLIKPFSSKELLARVRSQISIAKKRREAEEKIRESESRFRTLADALPQMVWMRDMHGNIEYGSKHWEEYSGIEGVSEAWREMVHPNDWNNIMHTWETHFGNGEAFQYEVRLKHKSGEYRWHNAVAEPLKDAGGKIVKWIGAVSDIHHQKEFSENLEKLVAERTAELERSNEDLQQFAHVASHDLKEPVRKVMTFSNRMKEELGNQMPARSIDYLNKIQKSAMRMYSMIDGVLLYSSLNSVEQTKEEVDLNELMENIEYDLEVPISQKDAKLYFEKLPVISGSSILLYQLFYNLFNNSLKFTRQGVAPMIRLSAMTVNNAELQHKILKPSAKYYKLVLEDNGIGFGREDAEKIFSTFTRLNAKDKYEGTGLGLSLCRKIVERHDGIIYAEGEENVGARFVIILPA
ncbi:MAG TPA: ATP-binding protein [Flavitalea sp.]|nr:ATP-binding protein [Flavitalea sp.]